MNRASPVPGALLAFCINQGISASFFLLYFLIGRLQITRFLSIKRPEHPWTVAHQAPLSMGSPRQQYWSGLPFPPPGDLPDSRIESRLLYLLHCRQILHQLSHRGSPKLPRDKPIWRISCAGNLLCSLSRVQKKEMEWGRGQRAGRFPRGH